MENNLEETEKDTLTQDERAQNERMREEAAQKEKKAAEEKTTEESAQKLTVSERRRKAKEKRSFASQRAKTRLGTERKPAKEVHSFDLQKPLEKNEENNKAAPRISPRRIMDFWEGFQKRQLEGLKKAGVSTTGYKISHVKMLYDKNGKETSVKVSFAGGGSIEDAGDKIKVFHSIRRKKPSFNKLYALLQAIRERGWKAVEGEIPSEMRAIVLRACKAAGIPLQTAAETKAAQQQQNRTVKASGATLNLYHTDESHDGHSSAYEMTHDWGREAYRGSQQYQFDRLIDALFKKSNGVATAELKKMCEDRAIVLMREMFGNALADEMIKNDRIQSGEAMAFFMKHMGKTPEESQAFYKSLSPEDRITVFEYSKKLDNSSDLAVRAQQVTVSLERYLNGTASAAEQQLFQELEGKAKVKLTSLDDLKKLRSGDVNHMMTQFGRKGLEFDDRFKAENGFMMPCETLGNEAADRAADVLMTKTTRSEINTVQECYATYPTSTADFLAKAKQDERDTEIHNRERMETARQEKQAMLRQNVPDFVKPAKNLPEDRRVLAQPEGMAAYIGLSADEIKKLAELPNADKRKKLVNQAIQYYNLLKKDTSLTLEAFKKSLDSFVTGDALTRQETMEALKQKNIAAKAARREAVARGENPVVKAVEVQALQPQENAAVKPTNKNEMSTLDIAAKLKKMQKKETAKEPPATARRTNADDTRGKQFQAYVLRQRAMGR